MEIKITESVKFNEPSISRDHPIVKEGGTGTQKIWKFKNGYGASVVRFGLGNLSSIPGGGSYGVEKGLWELAVIKFTGEDTFALVYNTKITNDVLGYLTEEQVEENLKKIQKLKEVRK